MALALGVRAGSAAQGDAALEDIEAEAKQSPRCQKALAMLAAGQPPRGARAA